jgi:hypothetical protein
MQLNIHRNGGPDREQKDHRVRPVAHNSVRMSVAIEPLEELISEARDVLTQPIAFHREP